MPRESEIIARIRARAGPSHRAIVGIGDDAAVIADSGERDLIACCDLSIEGIHFRTEWSPPNLIGRKALTVTLSDVAAMGGAPRFAMVSVALPATAMQDFIDELFRGIFEMAETNGVAIIGGDTSSSPGSLFIDTIALGECAKGRAVTRGGARPGDIIYVTGTLGAAGLGLLLLEQGHRLTDENQIRRQALRKHLAPEPLLRAGQAIGEAGLATAMIDISDGLSTDLWHILEESGCGAIVHAEALPIAECVTALAADDPRLDPLHLALHGGEEYELLFTAAPEDRDQVLELSNALGLTITAVGEIVSGKKMHLEYEGTLEVLQPGGYEHLRA